MIVKIPIKPYNMGDIGIFPFILEGMICQMDLS